MLVPGKCTTEHRFPSPGNKAFNTVYGMPLDFYTYSNEFDNWPTLNFALSMEELARNQLPFLESSYSLDRTKGVPVIIHKPIRELNSF